MLNFLTVKLRLLVADDSWLIVSLIVAVNWYGEELKINCRNAKVPGLLFKAKNRKYLQMKNYYLNNLIQYLHSHKINLYPIAQERMLLNKAVSIL